MPASGGHLIYALLTGAARALTPARSLSLRLTLGLLLYLALGFFLSLLLRFLSGSFTNYLALLRNLAFRFLTRNFLSRCSHNNSLRVGITGPSIYIRK